MEAIATTEEEKLLFDHLKTKCRTLIDVVNQIANLALVSPKDWNEKEVAKLYSDKDQLVETIAMQSAKLFLPTDFFDQTLKTL